MTTTIASPQTRCRAALAECDITPPAGIYHRMWGAATHDRATGVHRPLVATLLWLEPRDGPAGERLLIAALDHCILDAADIGQMQAAVATAAGVPTARVLIALTHTHAAGLMSRSRAGLPGGELIGPYLDDVAERLARLAANMAERVEPATIVYGRGRCDLAAQRDYFDEQTGQIVCGLNPEGPADDTVMVGRVAGEGGSTLGTIVNYACHATTLAWQNTLISPDYVGTMRETIQQRFAGPCLFLQGASGDLGPREGFVGDPAIADRNGRQLGFAALSALESLPPPSTYFRYAGPVVSGATLGTWTHEPVDAATAQRQARWHMDQWTVPLPYRPELPTLEQAVADESKWRAAEERAIAAGDAPAARDCHAHIERAQRQRWRLASLPPERFPLPVTLAQLGDARWLFVPGEHYQALQTALREQSAGIPLLVSTITGGWQPGYIPPAEAYGRGIYQAEIATLAAGSAERLTAEISSHLQALSPP